MIWSFWTLISFLAFNLCLFSFAETSLASESSTLGSNFRFFYDLTMRWINFGVIIFVVTKYGYHPLKEYIQQQRKNVKDQISLLKSKSEKIKIELKEAIKLRQKNEKFLKELKNRIFLEGEKKFQEIVENANLQSKILLNDAKQKAESRIIMAEKKVKDEVITAAIASAEKKLKKQIDSEYNKYLFKNYVKKIEIGI